MPEIEVPCPTCAGTGDSTCEDRHTGTNMDTCRTCGGRRVIPARPGESRETSWPYAVPGARQPADAVGAPLPAWMPEIAREGCQRGADEQGFGVDYRSGGYDDTRAFRSSMHSLHLAIERGHVVEARPMPSDDEMLKAAREDAAQVRHRSGCGYELITDLEQGGRDGSLEVRSALQARRNMLREMGAVRAPAEPAVDLEPHLRRAWNDGYLTSIAVLKAVQRGDGDTKTMRQEEMDADVKRILSALPTREA